LFVKPALRLAVTMLILLAAVSAWAGTTGKIAGVVTDKESGEPLPGVNVMIVGTTVGAATNIHGEFFIINVPPGSYTLRATLIGYGPVEVKNVQVSVDLTTPVDFKLSTQTIEMGTVTVEAERPLIEKDLTSSRTTISPNQLTNSAVNGIVAAANLTAGSVLGSFRGGRTDQGEVIYMLDGVNLSNPLGETRVGRNPGSGPSTALSTYVPNEAIAEAEVLTGGFGAEYPNVQSAIINMVSKTGGDKYSGKIKSKSSPEVLFATGNNGTNRFFIPGTGGGGQEILLDQPKVDKYGRNDYYDMRQHEFSFGGPVPVSSIDVPGKLSFFTSGIYSYTRGYLDQRSWSKTQSMLGKLAYDFSASKKLVVSGLKSFGSSLPWDRERFFHLTWGDPVYYHTFPISTATNTREPEDITYTPYSWIVAPGHVEDQADTVFFRYMFNHTADSSWLSTNFGNYGLVTDSTLLFGGRDSVNSTGWAKSYSAYDMGNTLGRPETWSNEFSASFTNNLSVKSFYNLSYSRFLSAQRVRVYDPWDGHPLSDDELGQQRFVPKITTLYGSILRGNPMYISRYTQDDQTITQTLKGDFTSQVNSYNLVKFGAESKWFDLTYNYRSKASGNNEYNSQYHEKPIQLGFYGQDKIETQGMIVNVGLRYDYFDPRTLVPFNYYDPLNPGYNDVNNPLYGDVSNLSARLKNPYPAKKEQQVSPRVGVSFPITDKDVLHVTYGHYFQLPVFDDYYTNHAFDLRGAFKYIGNPNLEAEKTVAYEAGLEHGFNAYMKLAVTGFYKDISGLVDHQRYYNSSTGQIFWINANSDYARVKGFEITLSQRPWHNFSGIVTYTYQIARGKSSDKTQGFLDNYYGLMPRTEDFPLDWDQRHTAKADVNWRSPKTLGPALGDFGLDVVFTFGSGRPFTGTSNVLHPNLPPINDKRFPNTWTIDLRVDKGFDFYKGANLDGFIEIQNLTNEANVNLNTVNSDNFDVQYYETSGNPAGQYADPSFWTAPRRILAGIQLEF
jgi:outer membrane receptor protein involved in Fe transport